MIRINDFVNLYPLLDIDDGDGFLTPTELKSLEAKEINYLNMHLQNFKDDS
jgi:hypothetical protein